MTVLDDIRAAVKASRESGNATSKGQARFQLNQWKGEQRKLLDAEYTRRLAEIEAMPEGASLEPIDLLGLVAEAVNTGHSRTQLRIALGKASLPEVDAVIARARDHFQQQVETGELQPFTLRPTGKVHAKGWPMYSVTLHETGESFEAVYLVTTGNLPATRKHLRIMPAPAGSQEILDRLDEVGVTGEIFARGKES